MTAHSTSRPSWQSDFCPPWCVVEHAEDDQPPDRVHDSVSLHVPAVLAPGLVHAPTTDLVAVVSRRCGELEDWVLIGEPERDGQHLHLSRESAVRVLKALSDLLAEAD